MQRQMLHGKIHGATVTEARLDYNGSITIDANLMAAADILEGEKVLIASLTNGARFESYAITGPAGSGVICLNGAAAHHGEPGDKVIIINFALLSEIELKQHKPRVIRVNDKNEILKPRAFSPL